MTPKAVILLFNPVSGHGHLDSWNAMFVRILLKRGYFVLALTGNRKALKQRLDLMGVRGHPALRVLKWKSRPTLQYPAVISRLAHWWWISAEVYGLRLPGSFPLPGSSPLVKWKKKLFQYVIPPCYWATKFLASLLGVLPQPSKATPTVAEPEHDSPEPEEHGFLEPIDTAQRIINAVRAVAPQPEFVFNMYMDMYKLTPKRWRAFADLCPFPWGGIRFVPQGTDRLESYYSLPSMRGMCFLDENVCGAYTASLPDKVFEYLPDITFAGLPKTETSLVKTLRQRAKGRHVVFMGGSIGGQKNLARWSGLIHRADPMRFFFVQVGEIHPSTFDIVDAMAMDQLKNDPPENLLIHDEYLEKDEDFNAIIAASEVIFAVYKNFRISSNMLGKAANFEKPILVASGYRMGKLVDEYGIGRAVPEDDEPAMLEALNALVTNAPLPHNYARYREVFSENHVADVLERFIAGCLRRA